MHRTTGKIAKIESKKRWLDSLRYFVRGTPTSTPFAFNLSEHRRNRFSSERQGRPNKTSPLGNGIVPAKEATLGTGKPLPPMPKA